MKRYGFTLIELLIVLLVITILVSILLPVFVSARQQSYATACASNLRQLAQATLLYTNDHDECFPPGVYAVQSDTTRCLRTVWGIIQPYLRSNKVLLCRANAHPTQLSGLATATSVGMPPCPDEPAMVSLVSNWCLTVNSWLYPTESAVSLARLPYPVGTSFWHDAWFISSDDGRFEPVGLIDARHTLSRSVPNRVLAGTESHWKGRVQAVYVDGHVQSHPTRLRADVSQQGQLMQITVRPQTIDGRRVPVWYIQGGIYHGRPVLLGWPSRPSESDPSRMLLQCYVRSHYCDEW